MKKQFYTLAALLITSLAANAQVGIGTTTPGSTLQVAGSLAPNYTSITAATYTLTNADYYVVFNGTADGTFTLPVSVANMKGRIYTIKNTTAAKALALKPAGSETIDANTSVSIPSGNSVQVVNTGLTGANSTWEVVSFNNATGSGGTGNFTVESSCTAISTAINHTIVNTTYTAPTHTATLADIQGAMDAGYNLIGIQCTPVPGASTAVSPQMPAPTAYAGKTFVLYVFDNYAAGAAGNSWGNRLCPVLPLGTRYQSYIGNGTNYTQTEVVTGGNMSYTGAIAQNSFGGPSTSTALTATATRRVLAFVMYSTGEVWINKTEYCPTFVTYKKP